MDNRRHTRVQFFQVNQNHDLQPVWVFRHAAPEAILGLLLDIGPGGVQVLTDKAAVPTNERYDLLVHEDGSAEGLLCNVAVLRKWTNPEGSLYFRSGFEFEETAGASALAEKLLNAANAGQKWLRCELMPS
ncbi:MAG: PilZ domain-containing protein [Burkholderiales bacterium]|nr:PilZ domain-containing protein [Burkholderiales bacterium]